VDHGEVVGMTLLVARLHAVELLEAVDQALNEVAHSISRSVEVGLSTMVALASDHRANVALAQVAPSFGAALALFACSPPRARPAPPPDSAVVAGACGVLVGADHAHVDQVQAPVHFAMRICRSLKRLEDPLPHAECAPAVEAAQHRPNCAIARR
jgi:hypothetical protein